MKVELAAMLQLQQQAWDRYIESDNRVGELLLSLTDALNDLSNGSLEHALQCRSEALALLAAIEGHKERADLAVYEYCCLADAELKHRRQAMARHAPASR